ncbi:phospholipase D-like domain-containing protein [Rhizobium leguminosarum]|uniref:phospholipase D-like domain-containing protein n=1 Tax=Rhizobium leguminosarum TaxID=384 RepID=UPI001442282B|nr:phospholipase D-like domain-containing protein [Rhizobium leguminosarum]NKL88040.1 trypsin-like serine protease [Rhizobium leguminosarum bv. viciae]
MNGKGKLSVKQVNRRNIAAPYANDQELVRRLAAEQRSLSTYLAPAPIEILEGARSAPEHAAVPDEEFRRESVALRRGRPVLAIREGQTVLEFREAESAVWKEKLVGAAKVLRKAIPSVGRIELTNLIAYPSIGTGWMVDSDIIATNRHVADFFVENSGSGFRFRLGDDRRKVVGARVDFLEEIDSTLQSEFDITEIVFVAPATMPDIALFRVRASAGTTIPPKLELSKTSSDMGKTVVVVGYPHRDPDLPDQKLMDDIFGNIYERKRIAPGFVIEHLAADLTHDCTTLRGNSGSPVIDLEAGNIVGLHRAGIFLSRNLAVNSTRIREILDLARHAPIIGAGKASLRIEASSLASTENRNLPMNEVKITIPLTITVSFGAPQVGGTQQVVAVTPTTPQTVRTGLTWEDIERAVPAIQLALANRPDVVTVKPGYRVTAGVMTKEPVVVTAVRQRYTPEMLTSMGIMPIPTSIDGYPIDVTIASVAEVLGIDRTLVGESAWHSAYDRPNIPLAESNGETTLTISASPDSGWSVLRDFLARTRKRLDVAMYDFGAPHVLAAVRQAVSPSPRKMAMVIQKGQSLLGEIKKNDVRDAEAIGAIREIMGERLDQAYASVAKIGNNLTNPKGLFEYSYHIKVAVRDGKEFWLSSGNWQSSNQPPSDAAGTPTEQWKTYNREWHAVVENQELAATFQRHITQDLIEAKETAEDEAVSTEEFVWVPIEYFQPDPEVMEAAAPPYVTRPAKTFTGQMKIQPLLTPDNFSPEIVRLLEKAESRILFQNQTFKPSADGSDRPGFRELIDVLLRKQKDGLDVRLIVRDIDDNFRQVVTDIVRRGFDLDRIKANGHCHTKGIIVDDFAAVIGSHNWSPTGTTTNRDASLIVYDRRVVDYFEDLFEEDWRRSPKVRFRENLPAVVVDDPAESIAPARMVRVSLREWLGE